MNQYFGQPASPDPARPAGSDHAPAFPGVRTELPATPEQALFQIDLVRSLRHHWRLALAVALGFVVLAVAYIFMQVRVRKSWPTFVAESTIYVQPTPGKVLPSEGGPGRWPNDPNTYESYIQQQMTNVSREDVLISAVHKLDGFQVRGESDQAAAQRFVGALQVTRDAGAYQFTIGARAGNPEVAAKIANAATAAYIESASRDERAGDAQRLAILKEEKERIEAVLVSDRAEQDALNKQLGMASISTNIPDHFDEDITQIRAELVKARTDHDAAEARYASLDAGKGTTSAAIDGEADQMIATDPGLISMKTSLNARRAALISQMANLTPANPQYKQDETELAKINADLDAMMKDLRSRAAARIQLQLRADLQRTGGLEAQLNGQLRDLVGSAGSATPKLQRSSDLAADITRLQARYAAVDEQTHNLILEDNAPAAAYQVTAAVPPLYRSRSGVFRNGVLIVFAGLFFAVVSAVIARKMDPRLYLAADVERILGFAPLAQLPDFTQVSEGTAEEYLLRLASAVEHGRKQGELRTCIFTGTGPAVGVSTIVGRVRRMLEAMGQSTVLIDATGAQAPSTAAEPKLPESARSLVTIERANRPSSLLQQVTGESEAEEQALVLTDTAPLAESAETEYLARFVDCAIVVIESGVSTRTQLRELATTLQRLKVRSVGFVLNRISLHNADRAFRIAVEAVEKRQAAQARHTPPRPERKSASPVRGLVEEPKPRETLHQEPDARPFFVPEVAAAAAAVARFAAHPASAEVCLASAPAAIPSDKYKPLTVPLASSAVQPVAPQPAPENSTASPSPAIAPPAHPPTPSAPSQPQDRTADQPTQPAAERDSSDDVPWWLSDTPRAAEPVRPPVLWQPAKASATREETSELWPVAPKLNPQPSAGPTAQPKPDSRGPAPAPGPEPKQEIGLAPACVPAEETPAHMTSRLSGLRNLLFVLGVKDAPPPADPDDDDGGHRANLNTPAEDQGEVGGASRRHGTAPPEFLPPRPVVLEFEKTDPRSGDPLARLDRRDPKARVEILPSRRGQYRKG